jgi:two-component system, sensor histidine kinase and response regulator
MEKNIRVLVAEDDYLVSEMIQGLLEEIGYTVAGTARDGRQAVELAEALQPDVLLLDIQMPRVDGLSAAQLIQERRPLPVVILTAYETPDLVEEASRSGAGAYLIKPPNGRELERAITIARARFQDLVKLHELNRELQSYNEELDAFAHTVAHDLQNPLSLTMGFMELLKSEYGRLSETEVREYIERVTHNTAKMSRIVDELLLLATVRRLEVEVQPLNTAQIVAEATQRLSHLAQRFQAHIELPDTWPAALGHNGWVEEVWVNYLSNALKYGGSPPHIVLGAEEGADGKVTFWVRDNGPGISRENQARLFLPFTKLSEVRVDGHGLGLSIVQRIITRLGGEVGVESAPGEGSTFWFRLPGIRLPRPSGAATQPSSSGSAH